VNAFERLLCGILGVGCLVTAFRFFLPNEKRHAYAFMTALVAAFFLCFALLGEPRERIACWLVAVALLFMAAEFLRHEKFSYAFTCVMIAVFFFCSGLLWVQRFVENGLIAAFNHRVNAFQDSLDQQTDTNKSIETQLRSAQWTITEQQENIAKQYLQISNLESQLASAQTDLIAQQHKIQSVEDAVNSLFQRERFESFDMNDSNRVSIFTFTNGARFLCFRLKHAPIERSVRGSFYSAGSMHPMVPLGVIRGLNVADCTFAAGSDVSSIASFSLEYVQDVRQTNSVRKIEFDGTNVIIDGTVQVFGGEPPDN
jgi:hypothetical protein